MKVFSADKTIYHIIYTGLLLLFINTNISGQDRSNTGTYETRYTIWGGYSAQSIQFLGKTGNSQTQILRVGFQRHIKDLKEGLSFWYTASVIPYISFDYPKRDANDMRTTNSGFGISPAGFMVKNHKSRWFTPFAQTTGGIIFMDDFFPTDEARRLNFTFDIILGNIIQINSFSDLSLDISIIIFQMLRPEIKTPGLIQTFYF